MGTYLIRRIFLIIPTLFLVTLIVFLSIRFIPGTVIDIMVNEMGREGGAMGVIDIEYIKHTMGLDVPIHVQFGKWLWSALQGNLGRSLWSHSTVTGELMARLPVSAELGLIAIIVGLLIAIPIGIYSAIRQDTLYDYIGRTVAIIFISVPSFWIGTMAIIYPAVWWNWTPSFAYISFIKDPIGNLTQFIIPGIIMGMVTSGVTMRMTRTMMLEVLRQDYIRTAWSKGLREKIVIARHALKNALLPIVTIVGLQMPIMIGGTVVVEQIFALPGIGRFLVDSLSKRDYPMISGINLVMASFVLVINLITDITYAYLDPRVSYK